MCNNTSPLSVQPRFKPNILRNAFLTNEHVTYISLENNHPLILEITNSILSLSVSTIIKAQVIFPYFLTNEIYYTTYV